MVFDKILMMVILVFVVVALFLISYFVVRLILRSRQAYYSVVRILGGSKRIVKNLISIELFTVCAIAFIVVFSTLRFTREGGIDIPIFSEAMQHIEWVDYAVLFVALMVMTALIANRVANSLFTKSAAQTYREGAKQ